LPLFAEQQSAMNVPLKEKVQVFRTHMVVAVASALFMLVSKYGFL
jgi:uncharacterized membrane protein YhiD involved in acid resistance